MGLLIIGKGVVVLVVVVVVVVGGGIVMVNWDRQRGLSKILPSNK